MKCLCWILDIDKLNTWNLAFEGHKNSIWATNLHNNQKSALYVRIPFTNALSLKLILKSHQYIRRCNSIYCFLFENLPLECNYSTIKSSLEITATFWQFMEVIILSILSPSNNQFDAETSVFISNLFKLRCVREFRHVPINS